MSSAWQRSLKRFELIRNPDYCNCNEFEKAVGNNDIRYYRTENDRFDAVKMQVGSSVKI
jgi:hypothetical protein